MQILNALTGKSTGWVNHPVVRAWKGHELSLACYGLRVCTEWIDRGYKDTCGDKIAAIVRTLTGPYTLPSWLDDERVHSSYRSLLLYKDPEWYGQWGWGEKPIEKIDYRLMGVK